MYQYYKIIEISRLMNGYMISFDHEKVGKVIKIFDKYMEHYRYLEKEYLLKLGWNLFSDLQIFKYLYLDGDYYWFIYLRQISKYDKNKYDKTLEKQIIGWIKDNISARLELGTSDIFKSADEFDKFNRRWVDPPKKKICFYEQFCDIKLIFF